MTVAAPRGPISYIKETRWMHSKDNSGPGNGPHDTAVRIQNSDFTDFTPPTTRNSQPEPDGHACPITRNSRARCLAWKAGGLPAALRCFALHHNWHEPGPIANPLKLRLAFKKPIRAAVNELLADRRDGLAAKIETTFFNLQEKIQSLDRMCVKRCSEEDELLTLEHTKAHLAESLGDLADLIDSSQVSAVSGQKAGRKIVDIPQEEPLRATPSPLRGTPPLHGESESWVTYGEAATLLGVSKSTVSKWAKKGHFADNGQNGQKRRLGRVSVLMFRDDLEAKTLRQDIRDLREDGRRLGD